MRSKVTTETSPEMRDAVVRAALVHVPFDGWGRATLRRAAREIGQEAALADQLFPGGAVEAVEHFADLADRLMLAEMAVRDLAGLRTGARVALAVRLRLEPWNEHREAVRRALGLLALSANAPVAARSTWRTVDAIWRAAGDTATDFSFYSKRATLAAVWMPTVLYWLDDASPGAEDTWAFLERRLADIGRIPRLRAQLRRRFGWRPTLDPRRASRVDKGG